jgi:tRNA A-37 threonylcarbamoyl transferase component Bud32
MLQMARYQSALQKLGLASVDAARLFEGKLVKNHKGKRDILIVPEHRSGLPEMLFVKRIWKSNRQDGIKSVLRHGRVWSQARIEYENALTLLANGINVAAPVAFGEECGLFWEKFSFIVTAAAPGEGTVAEFAARTKDRAARRRVFQALAKFIERMHQAGLATPDLFARHIFVKDGSKPAFCLIDMARLDRKRNLSDWMRARDLAALNVSLPLRDVSMTERLRFLSDYGGGPTLRRLIERRSRYLLKRKKFADFARVLTEPLPSTPEGTTQAQG